MENNITKIPIKNSGKGVTLPLNSWKRGYGPPPLVLTFTDDPPLWGPSPPPPPHPRKNVPSLSKKKGELENCMFCNLLTIEVFKIICLAADIQIDS